MTEGEGGVRKSPNLRDVKKIVFVCLSLVVDEKQYFLSFHTKRPSLVLFVLVKRIKLTSETTKGAQDQMKDEPAERYPILK